MARRVRRPVKRADAAFRGSRGRAREEGVLGAASRDDRRSRAQALVAFRVARVTATPRKRMPVFWTRVPLRAAPAERAQLTPVKQAGKGTTPALSLERLSLALD